MAQEISVDELGQDLAGYLEMVSGGSQEIVVCMDGGANVVMIGENELGSLRETAFIERDANRMGRLAKSVEQAKSGKTHRFRSVTELREAAMRNAGT